MPKLTDTQTMLLAHASQRDDSSLYPLPEALAGTDRATRAVAALIKHSLAEERETSDAAAVSRTDGDLRFGVFVTAAGLAAIGIADEDGSSADTAAGPIAEQVVVEPALRITKTSVVLDLLRRDGGATLAELVEATGWLPHTTRAALTGLRKKGHDVERYKRDDVTCYRIGCVA